MPGFTAIVRGGNPSSGRGQKILICDIGGGTTDFTLIRVRERSRPDEHGHTLALHRVAVGEHLILGGDNLDLAVARLLEQRLAERSDLIKTAEVRTSSRRQWETLLRQARIIKETMLGDSAPEKFVVTVPRGRRLAIDRLRSTARSDPRRDPRIDFGRIFPGLSPDRSTDRAEQWLHGVRPAVRRPIAP